jgi:hypothetical protein
VFQANRFSQRGSFTASDGGKTQEVNEDNDDFEYRLPFFFNFLRLVAALWNVKKYGESVLSCILRTCQLIKVAKASDKKNKFESLYFKLFAIYGEKITFCMWYLCSMKQYSQVGCKV